MLDDDHDVSQNDIAIIGMSVRVPGASNVREYWENLRDGVESIRTLSDEELIEAGESVEQIRRKNYIPRTADLPEMEMFDAGFFGFSPKEAAIMDPQHRHFLECAWEAFEDAARPPESISGPVGVFAGCGMGSYFYFNVCSHRNLVDQVGMFLLRHTGNDKDFLATRASYQFDLRGPSFNIQTACSTSLVAVHQACQSLFNGECEMAIAGGVTIDLPHRRGYIYQESEILSPDGHCRSFDHRAGGTIFGSGAGVVVLRRLSDAIADGDPIRAVIKSTAVNNDGASKAGYLAPSVSGQAEAIVEAHGLADVSADTISYVECHGTATNLGDPIEIAALSEAFRQSTDKKGFCRIGSVKSNIGHLDTAAGVASLVKTVLAMENGQFPPSLGYEKPNPSIDFENSPFVVNDRLTRWDRTGGPRRAGINSLGVGGTNAHLILEEAPLRASEEKSAQEEHLEPQLLILSAKNKNALDEGGRRLSAHLEANPELSLSDVAYTLKEGRRCFEHRRVVAVCDRHDAIKVLGKSDSRRFGNHTLVEDNSGPVFQFSGGGAQYPGMARNLYEGEEAFAAVVDEGLSYLSNDVESEIRDLWLGDHGEDSSVTKRFLRPSMQLPAILIVEVAIARLWMSWGVKPDALIGHSMGENAAACIAGVLSFENAVKLVHLRGELFDEIKGGGMLSVPLGYEDVEKRLPAGMDIAAINAPELCVVSGPNELLNDFSELLEREDVDASRIPIDIAAHSQMLKPILGRFEAFLSEIPLSAPNIPLVSNLTGTWLTAEQAQDPHYWVEHLQSTVRFADGLSMLAEDPGRIYIEVGPGRVLSSLAKAQGVIAANQVINSLPHIEETCDDRLHFLTAVGRAWSLGLDVPIERFWSSAKPRRVSLPTYAFQHQHYFLDRVAAGGSSQEEQTLLKRPDILNWGWRPSWKPTYADIQSDAELTPSSALIFLDEEGVGAALAERLSGLGHRVSTVELGDAFRVSGENHFVLCPEHGREGYDGLIAHLAAHGGLPERIFHFWLVTGEEDFRPGSSFFHRNQERGFHSLFHLAQALSNEELVSPLQISVVTNGMVRVGDEPLPYPEKATVLGPVQVLPREMSDVFVRVIDIAVDASRQQQGRVQAGVEFLADRVTNMLGAKGKISTLDMIWDDVFARNGNEIVAYRDGRRLVRVYDEIALEERAQGKVSFRNGGVYLVTGGLGDLATAMCEELAKQYKVKLSLIGRTELPARMEWPEYLASYGDSDRIGKAIAAIMRIEDAGADVLYTPADVTNPEVMRGVIAKTKERFGALNGVLHTAGVVKDELIQLKNSSDIEDVFAPKVLGTLVLDEVLSGEALDLFVLFSSTSTDTAPAGQVDYVAANAYLNAFADSRAGQSGPLTVAVHWGVWNEVGLAARAINNAERDEAPASVEPATQPLFDRRLRVESKGDWLEMRCEPSRQWLLDEHRLSTGEAVWPGTGYLELIGQAAREHGILGPFEVEDLTFLRPLHVEDGHSRAIRVSFQRDGGRFLIGVESKFETEEGVVSWVRHAEASVSSMRSGAPSTLDIPELVARCDVKTIDGNGAAMRSAQEDHLRFGPRWQVLRSVHIGSGMAMAKLQLNEKFESDIDSFLLHPALMDISTGYAMDLIDGYDSGEGLWVPMTYGKVRVYRPLPSLVWSKVVLNKEQGLGPGYATFDVTIIDERGRVLVEVEGFTIKQLDRNVDFSASLRDVTDLKLEAKQKGATSELSPALARLAAQVDQGICPAEGFEALKRVLGTGLSQVVVSSLDLARLQANVSATEDESVDSASFERPNIDSEFVEPRNEIEKTLAGFWTELLGIQQIGVEDNFFDLGGHSLIAVRLFRMMKKAYNVDFPISVLFEAPTIAQCGELIEQSGAVATGAEEQTSDQPSATNVKSRTTHLVQMHEGKDFGRTPLFVCAGMFGNILNLRHLAVQIGQDRPVYGLQARGLYGDQAPHETFEEMARANLVEVRSVQPHGPYLLSGFSGGGLVAFEMAQQLIADGEVVAMVVMLDTPFPEEPELSVKDLVAMKVQDLRREKAAFVGTWIKKRIAWELSRLRKKDDSSEDASPEHFQNEAIEAAFRRALTRYEAKSYTSPVLLMRPKLQIAYELSDGLLLNADRCILKADNGWSPYVLKLEIIEVPGDHDGMVLEPNVRVLAGHVRALLKKAESAAQAVLMAAE